MTLTVENGPVKLVFGSRRKEENDFVLGLEMKPIQYANTMTPTVEKDISLAQWNKVSQAQVQARPKVTFRSNARPGKNYSSSVVRGNATTQKDDQQRKIR